MVQPLSALAQNKSPATLPATVRVRIMGHLSVPGVRRGPARGLLGVHPVTPLSGAS